MGNRTQDLGLASRRFTAELRPGLKGLFLRRFLSDQNKTDSSLEGRLRDLAKKTRLSCQEKLLWGGRRSGSVGTVWAAPPRSPQPRLGDTSVVRLLSLAPSMQGIWAPL